MDGRMDDVLVSKRKQYRKKTEKKREQILVMRYRELHWRERMKEGRKGGRNDSVHWKEKGIRCVANQYILGWMDGWMDKRMEEWMTGY